MDEKRIKQAESNFRNYLNEGKIKKIDKFERRYSALGFVTLVLFVAVPLPGTGAWTGSILSWILGLDRKKSILAISLGVVLAGILVFAGTLGIFRLLL